LHAVKLQDAATYFASRMSRLKSAVQSRKSLLHATVREVRRGTNRGGAVLKIG
jgi:hypothetical protein